MSTKELTKLPRVLKRTLLLGLTLGSVKDQHHYGELKSSFLEAQRNYIASKNKRVDTTEK